LKSGKKVFGMRIEGIYVLLPTVNVSLICPTTFGVTGITLVLKVSGAGLRGIYVLLSIVIGLSVLDGTNSLLLIVITGVTFYPTGTTGLVGSLKTGWNTLGITSTGINVLF